jgi:hypothetical protein
MKIFIIHYTPLVLRKQNIIKLLGDSNINEYEIIESHDREKLTNNDIKKFSQINLAEISLFIKNIEIFKKEIDDIVVVIEDDAIFVDNFKDKLKKYLDELAIMEWDIVFSGECCNLHVKSESDKIFYESNYSRGTCMYILNRGVCKKLHDIINNEIYITKPIDHWFNDMKIKYNLKYYWSEPTLVYQGSEIGIFNSAIR